MNRFFLLFVSIMQLSFFANAQHRAALGKINSSLLQEVSGIAPSHLYKGNFWLHNDSGDDARIYLIDSTAQLKLTVEIEGIDVIDAEDISSLTINGEPYLLLADIGNNLRDRDTLSLYLIKEPIVESTSSTYRVSKSEVIVIQFRYGDKRRDAEALFVDPLDNTVYILSKRDFRSTVFSLKLPAGGVNAVQTLTPIMELPFTFVTASDISADGRYILVKNLTSIYLWNRKDNESIVATLKNAFERYPYVAEPQGEAICFDLYDRIFYTISERPFGLDAYLYKYVY